MLHRQLVVCQSTAHGPPDPMAARANKYHTWYERFTLAVLRSQIRSLLNLDAMYGMTFFMLIRFPVLVRSKIHCKDCGVGSPEVPLQFGSNCRVQNESQLFTEVAGKMIGLFLNNTHCSCPCLSPSICPTSYLAQISSASLTAWGSSGASFAWCLLSYILSISSSTSSPISAFPTSAKGHCFFVCLAAHLLSSQCARHSPLGSRCLPFSPLHQLGCQYRSGCRALYFSDPWTFFAAWKSEEGGSGNRAENCETTHLAFRNLCVSLVRVALRDIRHLDIASFLMWLHRFWGEGWGGADIL